MLNGDGVIVNPLVGASPATIRRNGGKETRGVAFPVPRDAATFGSRFLLFKYLVTKLLAGQLKIIRSIIWPTPKPDFSDNIADARHHSSSPRGVIKLYELFGCRSANSLNVLLLSRHYHRPPKSAFLYYGDAPFGNFDGRQAAARVRSVPWAPGRT